jgi:hypothetical protein
MRNHAKQLSFVCGLAAGLVSAVVSLNPNWSFGSEKVLVALGAYTVFQSNTWDQVPVSITLKNYPAGDTVNIFYYAYDSHNAAVGCSPPQVDPGPFINNGQQYQTTVLVGYSGNLPVSFYAEGEGVNGDGDQMQELQLGNYTLGSGPFTFGKPIGTKWYTVQVGATSTTQQNPLLLDFVANGGLTPRPQSESVILAPNASWIGSVMVPVEDTQLPVTLTVQQHGGTPTVTYTLGNTNPVTVTSAPLTLTAGPTFHMGQTTVPIHKELSLDSTYAASAHKNMKVFFSARDEAGVDHECTPSVVKHLSYTPTTGGSGTGLWDGPHAVTVDTSGVVHGQVTLTAILVLYDNGPNSPPTFIEPASHKQFGP